MALRELLLLSLLVMAIKSFQPNCDPDNQFRFHCFPIQYCNLYYCDDNKCGHFAIDSKLVRVKETEIIPKCAFSNSKVLEHVYGVNSKIEVIASGSFVNLTNLNSINFSFNLIKQLHSGTFNNVSATSLDLSWNKLVYIQEGAFLGLHNLRFLNLSRNELSTIPIHQIPPFLTELNLAYNLFERILLTSGRAPSLKDIDLSYNELEKIALSFNNPLGKIDLTHNRLKRFDFMEISQCEELKIPSNQFSVVPEPLIYLNVRKVLLYPNPWRCDELQNLWVQLQNNFVTLLPDVATNETDKTAPICVLPEYSGVTFYNSIIDRSQCGSDEHCDDNMICRNKRCLNPCNENVCDTTSVCNMEKRLFSCSCPYGKLKDPKDPYSPCLNTECFSSEDCEGLAYCNGKLKCVTYTPAYGGGSGSGGGGGSGSDEENDLWWTYEIPRSSPYHQGNESQRE
ncbi:hypothetical protein JTB14_008511 [Gonioctena quinquepunctata]|nr:hypothetical protein JTB14_008511 [Gonioctena quinquepunctata]